MLSLTIEQLVHLCSFLLMREQHATLGTASSSKLNRRHDKQVKTLFKNHDNDKKQPIQSTATVATMTRNGPRELLAVEEHKPVAPGFLRSLATRLS